jgi:hypothetical protein
MISFTYINLFFVSLNYVTANTSWYVHCAVCLETLNTGKSLSFQVGDNDSESREKNFLKKISFAIRRRYVKKLRNYSGRAFSIRFCIRQQGNPDRPANCMHFLQVITHLSAVQYPLPPPPPGAKVIDELPARTGTDQQRVPFASVMNIFCTLPFFID